MAVVEFAIKMCVFEFAFYFLTMWQNLTTLNGVIEDESKKQGKTKRNRTELGKVECGIKEKTFVIDDKGKSAMIDIKQLCES